MNVVHYTDKATRKILPLEFIVNTFVIKTILIPFLYKTQLHRSVIGNDFFRKKLLLQGFILYTFHRTALQKL